MDQPTTTIATGVTMPLLGFGTYLLDAGRECEGAVEAALAAGYRHIDTASMYDNEHSVGGAIRRSGLPRHEVFVTTKLWNSDQGRGSTRPAFEASLERLGLDHVDLYLIHWPHGTAWEASWEVMQGLVEEGLARAVGVSNFLVPHLDRIDALGLPRPANDQIELHPFVYARRRDVIDRCAADGVSLTAYSPLARGRRFDHPTIRAIADHHARTPAQVMLRWCLEHGFAPIPKSARPDRIRENAAVLEFSLAPDEVAALDAIDDPLVVSWNPDRTL